MSLKKQKILLAVAILSAGLFLAAVPLISQAGGLVPCGGAAEKPAGSVKRRKSEILVNNFLKYPSHSIIWPALF